MSDQNSNDRNQDTPARTERHLLEILVCPLTRGPLRYDAAAQELISEKAELAFPICKGVPMMSEAAARPLSEAEIAALKSRRR